jgi:hypothetical protein
MKPPSASPRITSLSPPEDNPTQEDDNNQTQDDDDDDDNDQDMENGDTVPEYKTVYAQNYQKVFCKERPESFYPHYWITFMLLGRPAGKNGRPPLEAGYYTLIFERFEVFQYLFTQGPLFLQEENQKLSDSITAEDIDLLSNKGYFNYYFR